MDRWFSIQAQFCPPKQSVKIIKSLCEHQKFKLLNPNNFNSVLTTFAKMNFSGYTFLAKDTNLIYHTNVVMSVCQHIVFICLDAVVEQRDKNHLLFLFAESGKKVINISISQMNSFLGNVLELKNKNGESFLIMSTSAYNSLNSSQLEIIDKYSTILHSSLDTIEYFGGGSARCMIAEVFLETIEF